MELVGRKTGHDKPCDLNGIRMCEIIRKSLFFSLCSYAVGIEFRIVSNKHTALAELKELRQHLFYIRRTNEHIVSYAGKT